MRLPRTSKSLKMTTIKRLLTRTGSGLGWMEGLWKGTDIEQIRLRSVRQAQELPRQRLPEIDVFV
jgi:hypothetical protein